jgi:hypothetical protein
VYRVNLIFCILIIHFFIAFNIAYSQNETQKAKTEEEIANELANPSSAITSLGMNFQYINFKGDLPGADSQDGWNLLFQPVIPYPFDFGWNLIFRPGIPILFSQPAFNSNSNQFETKNWELGDTGYDLVMATTFESGILFGLGAAGSIPTATSNLGSDQWTLGPELFIGLAKQWGVIGALINHQWDFAGEDSFDTSLTGGQYFASFNLGGGWQILSTPPFSYNHETDEWTLPVGGGVAKTLFIGKTPVRMNVQIWKFVAQPDDFGPDWQVRVGITPVLPLPW